tara:strand:+ start:443 stop:682 length:240 start_codon:yes stop_codon:yes gene_type:complete
MNWFIVLKRSWMNELTNSFAWDELIEVMVFENEGEIVITHELTQQSMDYFKDKYIIEFMSYNKSQLKPRYRYHIRRNET